MRPVLITPPATEPVSLAEAKLYLRIDQDDEDDLIRALVVAARLLVEAASGRMLIDQGWRIVLDRWPAGGVLRLPLSPVRQVTGVRVRDAAGAAAELAASALVLEIGADPPMLRVAQPVPPPGLPSGASRSICSWALVPARRRRRKGCARPCSPCAPAGSSAGATIWTAPPPACRRR